MNRRWLSVALTGALLFSLYALGVVARRQLVLTWSANVEGVPPFTLESALHFRRIELLRRGQPLPRVDMEIEYPVGIRTFASDTVGVEYPLAWLARRFPAHAAPETRVRWLSVLWFCLTIPALYAWVARASESPVGGAIAAAFYAVGLGAVIRSTGWEIQRENFALPFLAAHLAAEAAALRHREAPRRGWLALSAVLLALALLCWDLVQFYLGLRVIWLAVAWIRRPRGWTDPTWQLAFWPLAAAALAAVLHPYYRTHGLLVSPLATIPAALAVLLLWKRRCGESAPSRSETAAAIAIAVALSAVLAASYRESYGHFGGLLWAKLRYLNRKPANPALLTFEQRMLWTPALHSPTASDVMALFPVAGPLTLLVVVLYFIQIFQRGSWLPLPRFVVFSHVVSGLAFALFFRFHVFAALFGAALLGFAAAAALRARRLALTVVSFALLTAGAVAEALNTVSTDWVPSGAPYAELRELTDWLATRGRRQPVLAHFGLSGHVLAYAGSPIVLHPKFETSGIRRRVEAFLKELFTGTETSLRDWAVSHGAVYYVHTLGELSRSNPEYRMRYMVNALQPPAAAPVWAFELQPQRLTRFRYEWGNQRFRVFRIVTREDESVASELAVRARAALAEGRVSDAELMAERALRLFPGVADAPATLRQARSLRAAGFTGPSAEKR